MQVFPVIVASLALVLHVHPFSFFFLLLLIVSSFFPLFLDAVFLEAARGTTLQGGAIVSDAFQLALGGFAFGLGKNRLIG